VLLVAEEIFFVQGVFKFSPAIFFFVQVIFKFSPANFFYTGCI